jgi:uncharacterized membrane protein YukC
MDTMSEKEWTFPEVFAAYLTIIIVVVAICFTFAFCKVQDKEVKIYKLNRIATAQAEYDKCVKHSSDVRSEISCTYILRDYTP